MAATYYASWMAKLDPPRFVCAGKASHLVASSKQKFGGTDRQTFPPPPTREFVVRIELTSMASHL